MGVFAEDEADIGAIVEHERGHGVTEEVTGSGLVDIGIETIQRPDRFPLKAR